MGSTRFELTSNSPESSVLTSSYPNGQRASYTGPSLDRSGSFRENIENRTLTSGSTTSRGTSLVEMPPLAQSLVLEQFSLGEQRPTRLAELRKVLGLPLGTTSEDLSVGPVHSKPPFPVAAEEVRRFKASVLDTNTKARERAKTLNESITKLDKYRLTLQSKKRQRNEVSSSERSSGANLLKMGSQTHQNGSDLATQRVEDRTKSAVPNKRVRTSLAEVRSEGRNTSLLRQGMAMDKDRDLLRAGNGGLVQVEDKIRGLPAGDGWDKKMKRKRSVGTMVTRTMEGDRDIKRGMQQRLNVESRSRPCEGHGFRSGSSNALGGINKLDGSSQPGSSARAILRNDVENVALLNDKRDCATGLEKERVTTKGGNKLNLREDGQLGNTSPVTKGKASRAPRTGSGVLASSSSNFPRAVGALEGWEQPPCSNKAQVVSGANNRKRPMPTGSSSPPVAQWAGQRLHKNARARRTNLVSPVSNLEEAPVISESFQASDIGTRLTNTEAGGSLLARGISSNSQHFKLKPDSVVSPAGLSESEESGAGENRSKEKGLDGGDIEDRVANAVQKVGPFTMKKNKIFIKEDVGDGVRRQGRSGRGSAQSRGCLPSREKLENMATTKPLRNAKLGFDKSESKSGRPPTKRMSDRRAFTRPGKVVNSGSSEFTGESDDDNELLAAANAARNASNLACTGSFWKKMEPIFAFVSPEDMTYLKQQIHFAEELDESFSQMFSSDYSLTDETMGKPATPFQALAYGARQGSQLNGMGQNHCEKTTRSHDESLDSETLPGKLGAEKWLEKIIPLSQRLLSAFIVEDETEDFDHTSERRDASFQYTSEDSPCGTSSHNDSGDRMESQIESEVDLKTQKYSYLDNFSCDGSTASNGFRSPNIRSLLYNDETWQEEDASHPEVGQNNLYGSHSIQTSFSGTSSFECQYQKMGLDDRILAELHSIGLFPETVPDLTEEDEEINKDISELKKGLYQQMREQKGHLYNADKTIQKGREMEERGIERLSVNKLVEMAYEKYMFCRGSSSKGGVSKIARQAAFAFVKRTLARCQKFEESGRSCFSEPTLRDVIFYPTVCSNDSKSIDCIGSGTAANLYSEPRSCEPELRASDTGALVSGSISCTTERRGSVNGKLDRAPSDAFQAPTSTPDQIFTKHELASSRGKKREVLLDDVGVSASRATSTLGNTLPGGAKGKRSERDQNKDTSGRGSLVKVGGRPPGNAKGERKTKTKPKQKTAQLSMSGNGLLSRSTEAMNAVSETATNDNDRGKRELGNTAPKASKQIEEPLDFTNLQLPGLDLMEELDGSVDLSWFNIDEEGLQDQDLVGLQIPMDDLNSIL